MADWKCPCRHFDIDKQSIDYCIVTEIQYKEKGKSQNGVTYKRWKRKDKKWKIQDFCDIQCPYIDTDMAKFCKTYAPIYYYWENKEN